MNQDATGYAAGEPDETGRHGTRDVARSMHQPLPPNEHRHASPTDAHDTAAPTSEHAGIIHEPGSFESAAGAAVPANRVQELWRFTGTHLVRMASIVLPESAAPARRVSGPGKPNSR